MRTLLRSRLTYMWVALSAITVLSWWLAKSAHDGSHLVASTPVTLGVLAIGLVKARVIVQSFMEVRTAPRWLRRATDAWLFVFWAAVLVIYLS